MENTMTEKKVTKQKTKGHRERERTKNEQNTWYLIGFCVVFIAMNFKTTFKISILSNSYYKSKTMTKCGVCVCVCVFWSGGSFVGNI